MDLWGRNVFGERREGSGREAHSSSIVRVFSERRLKFPHGAGGEGGPSPLHARLGMGLVTPSPRDTGVFGHYTPPPQGRECA